MKFRDFFKKLFRRENQKLLLNERNNDEIENREDSIGQSYSANQFIDKLQDETKKAMEEKAKEEEINKILELSDAKEFFKYLISSEITQNTGNSIKLPKGILDNPRALDMISSQLARCYEYDRLSDVRDEEQLKNFAKKEGILSAEDKENECNRKKETLKNLRSYMHDLSEHGVRMPSGSERYIHFGKNYFSIETRGKESINGKGHIKHCRDNEEYTFVDSKGFNVSHSSYNVETDRDEFHQGEEIARSADVQFRNMGAIHALPDIADAKAINATSHHTVRYFDKNQIEKTMLRANSEINGEQMSRKARISGITRDEFRDGNLLYTRKEFKNNDILKTFDCWKNLTKGYYNGTPQSFKNIRIDGAPTYRVPLATGYDRYADTLDQTMDEFDHMRSDQQLEEYYKDEEEPESSLDHYELLWHSVSIAKYLDSKNMLEYFPVLKDKIPEIIDKNGGRIPSSANKKYIMPDELVKENEEQDH